MQNWLLLRDADYDTMVTLLSDMVNDFRQESDKLKSEKIFRIHWDGDFFSLDYARAWAFVIRHNPDVQFWVYTRSFTPALNVVPIIAGIDNLTVYLSVDTENILHAAGIRQQFPAVKIASLAKTASEAKAQIPSAKIISCPENVGKKLPLIVENPRGTMGACAACMLCVDGRADVAFATSGKE